MRSNNIKQVTDWTFKEIDDYIKDNWKYILKELYISYNHLAIHELKKYKGLDTLTLSETNSGNAIIRIEQLINKIKYKLSDYDEYPLKNIKPEIKEKYNIKEISESFIFGFEKLDYNIKT